MTDHAAHLALPSLRDAFAVVPGLVGRTVSVDASLAASTHARVRVEPQPRERSVGDLPRHAHQAYGRWIDDLRRLGIVLLGAEARVDVGPSDQQSRPTLTATDVQQLRRDLVEAIGSDSTCPHDLLIRTHDCAVRWSLYGLADLPQHRRARVSNLLDEHLRRGVRWLQGSPSCALLIPDDTMQPTRSMSTASPVRAGLDHHGDGDARSA